MTFAGVLRSGTARRGLADPVRHLKGAGSGDTESCRVNV